MNEPTIGVDRDARVGRLEAEHRDAVEEDRQRAEHGEPPRPDVDALGRRERERHEPL